MNASRIDLDYLKRAIALAEAARRRGNRPFGAVLVAADGAVLSEAENTTATDRDLTAHAEINAIRLASKTAGAERLAGASLYASGEPCPMCTGAVIRMGLGRVVFGITDEALRPYLPAAAGVMAGSVSCRELLHHAPRSVEVLGPLLDPEALAPFERYRDRGAAA